MYSTIDEIPAKTYFKIVETGNLSLLSKKKKEEIELLAAWETIQAEHSELESSKKDVKTLNVPKKIESLFARYEAIKLAIYVLRREDDEEMKDLLKSKGFTITDNLDNDLNVAEKESEAIIQQIEALQIKLPKINKDTSAKTPFDKVVLSYGALTGLGFVNTNKITLTQYYALVETGNDKITAMENANKKGNGVKR